MQNLKVGQKARNKLSCAWKSAICNLQKDSKQLLLEENQYFIVPKTCKSKKNFFSNFAWAPQLLSKKCRSSREPLATLCLIWPARDLNLRPPDPEKNALPLDQNWPVERKRVSFWSGRCEVQFDLIWLQFVKNLSNLSKIKLTNQ